MFYDYHDSRPLYVTAEHYTESPDKWVAMHGDVDVIVLHNGKPSITMRTPRELGDDAPSAAPRTVSGEEACRVLERGGRLGSQQPFYSGCSWRCVDGIVLYSWASVVDGQTRDVGAFMKDNHDFIFTVLDEGKPVAPDTHARELAARDDRIAELERSNETLIAQVAMWTSAHERACDDVAYVRGERDDLRAQLEDKRVERWHATYNATLPLISPGQSADDLDAALAEIHRCRVSLADICHGKLKPEGGG